MKKSRFSTDISLYLGNDTKYGQSYYGVRIGHRTKLSNIIFNDFERPVTQIQGLAFLTLNFLTLDMSESDTIRDTVIPTYTRPIQRFHFE